MKYLLPVALAAVTSYVIYPMVSSWFLTVFRVI